MPRTIFEATRSDIDYPPQRPAVPNGFVYIGATIFCGNKKPEWAWTPVRNYVTNWVLLNRYLSGVDYDIRDVSWGSAVIHIDDWDDFDYDKYHVFLSSPGMPTREFEMPDDTKTYRLTNLMSETTYTINVIAELKESAGGGVTEDSIQTFTTPLNPTPLPPSLSYSNATNSSIRLKWTGPADSSAVSWNIYRGVQGQQATIYRSGIPTLEATVADLRSNTKYHYAVSGVNGEGLEGPRSNVVRVATGQDEAWNNGSLSEYLVPHSVGSWRSDIGWKLWYARASNNVSLYQGYWQGDPRITGRTPSVILKERAGRYWGCIRYDTDEFRQRLTQRYGDGVWQALEPTKVEMIRLYRMVDTGGMYGTAHYIEWHIGQGYPHWGGQPSIVSSFRHGDNNTPDHVAAHDKMKPGQGIDWYRFPRYFGKALVSGHHQGAGVNTIIMYRDDNINTYNGTAGYGEWCGHRQYDRDNQSMRLSNPQYRYSDLHLLISGEYRVRTHAYSPPYEWR